MARLKTFPGKAKQSLQNFVNPKLVIGKICENNFESALRLKRVEKNQLMVFVERVP